LSLTLSEARCPAGTEKVFVPSTVTRVVMCLERPVRERTWVLNHRAPTQLTLADPVQLIVVVSALEDCPARISVIDPSIAFTNGLWLAGGTGGSGSMSRVFVAV
jgi:hypothetical protein